jgi:hypothetical protein
MNGITAQLRQDEFWTDADGRTQRLIEMELGHRHNLLRWLQRNATELARARVREIYPRSTAALGTVSFAGSGAAARELDRQVTAITPELAERWLARQPLVRKLVELRRQALAEAREMADRPAWPESEHDGVHGHNAHGDWPTFDRAFAELLGVREVRPGMAKPTARFTPLHDGEPKEKWRTAQERLDQAAKNYTAATGQPVHLFYGQTASRQALRRQRDGLLRDIKAVRQTVKDLRRELSIQRQENLALRGRLDRAEGDLRRRATDQYHLHILMPGEAAAPAGNAGQGTYFHVGEPFSWEDPRTRIRVSGAPTGPKAAFNAGAKHMVRRPTPTDELDAILFGGDEEGWEGHVSPGSDNYGSLT